MKIKLLSLLVVVSLILCGCNTPGKESASETEALSSTIDSYLQNEIYTGEDIPLMMEYQNSLLEKITYEIQSIDLESGTMDVTFTYIDVLQLADSMTDPNIAEEDYYAACIDKISSGDYETISEVVNVGFESSDEGYTLIQSEELTNVLSGGVLDYYLELLEEMGHE